MNNKKQRVDNKTIHEAARIQSNYSAEALLICNLATQNDLSQVPFSRSFHLSRETSLIDQTAQT